MVRPDESLILPDWDSCCIELAGGSPAAVSAGAPRSRPRVKRETSASEWGVECPREVYGFMEGSKSAGPAMSEPCSPVTRTPERSGGRAAHATAKATDCICEISGGMQDARGVWRRACGHSWVRNRRDPSRRPTSGEGGPYKPTVKGDRAGRESEGFIVPRTPAERPVEGRGPALVAAAYGR
jgi:hypothetical protein